MAPKYPQPQKDFPPPRWRLNSWPLSLGHWQLGHITIGPDIWWRNCSFAIECGIWRRDDAEPGERVWRWYGYWQWPIWLVRHHKFGKALPGEVDASAWTGRTSRVVGIMVGRRVWCWA